MFERSFIGIGCFGAIAKDAKMPLNLIPSYPALYANNAPDKIRYTFWPTNVKPN